MIVTARLARVPPPIKRLRYSGSRERGVRYEASVHRYFANLYGLRYLQSPWFQYMRANEQHFRWCQPDALLFDPRAGTILCIEVKTSHTDRAREQIRNLYEPVVRCVFPDHLWQLQVCEVVRYYSPHEYFGEPVQLVSNITQPSEKFKVHILKP